MTSEENYLDQLLADANDKLNQMENANDDSEAENEIDENVDDFVSKGEEELEEFMKQFDESSENAEDSSNPNSSDGEDLVPDDSDDLELALMTAVFPPAIAAARTPIESRKGKLNGLMIRDTP